MAFGLSGFSKLFKATVSGEEPRVLGIDIGSSALKLVELRREKERAVLGTYGEIQLGPYGGVQIGRATNLDPVKLTEALTDVMREAAVGGHKVGLAIPFAASFVAIIPIPGASATHLDSVMPIEARKYVPVPVSQVTLDWFLIPETKGPAHHKRESVPKEVRVLLAAIHNEALAKHRGVVEGAGLSIGFTEIEIFSAIRSSVDEKADVVMLVDIGAAMTKLYVVSRGIVQMTHSMTVGGQDMTLALSQALELSVSDAEELKRHAGLRTSIDTRVGKAINFTLERILNEARRVLDGYERRSGEKVGVVLFSGGGSMLKDMLLSAGQLFGREVRATHPFSKVEYPAFLEQTLRDIGPSFAVALGAALRMLSES